MQENSSDMEVAEQQRTRTRSQRFADTQHVAAQPHVLREYALIADGWRGALLGPRGNIAFMCAPRWDSEAAFAGLLGGAGTYLIAPQGRFVWGGYYEPSSLVWHNRWVTEKGIVECEEALAFPGDAHRAVVLRRLRALDGDADMVIECSPRQGFGRPAPASARYCGDRIWLGRSGTLAWRWRSSVDAAAREETGGTQIRAVEHLHEGECRDFILEISDASLPDELPDPDTLWETTRQSWAREVPSIGGLCPGEARQSYAVIRGMTAPSGAVVAAATTSLPERPTAGRNYDYRYSWIRDSSYCGLAASAAGADSLLSATADFVRDRLLADGGLLAPAYTITGGRVPEQRSTGLPGYPGGSDRIGNWVTDQFQLDAFGEALTLLARRLEQCGPDAGTRRAMDIAATAIGERWTEPDAGIWEIDNRRWTHSRLAAVAGLRAAAACSDPAHRDRWSQVADSIMDHLDRHAVNGSGRWMRAEDDERLDAALLFGPLRGAVAPEDPRSRRTLDGVLTDLTSEGFAYRFAHDDRPLGDAEGSFLLCGYLVALNLDQQHDYAQAIGWFERTRAATGPPGLYSEEFDAIQRQMRGNLPQAFVHALMLESSLWLDH